MSNKKSFYQKGQSLVEVTVATTAMVFALVAVISGLILAVKNSSSANKQALATQNAQEVIEVFRKYQRELGWESFYAVINADGASTTYCVISLPPTVQSFQAMPTGGCTVPADYAGFVREAQVTVNNATTITVVVNVEWQEGSITRTATATNIYRNFQ